jgi:hypothetical protein
MFFVSCSDDQGAAKLPTLTTEITDTVSDTTTVYVDKEWTLVRLDTISRGDSLLITVEMEANDGEHHVLRGFSTIRPEKTGYQIFADEEKLYPDYSNKNVRGGGMVKENVTDSGYVAVIVWAYPTNDGNIVYIENKMETLKKVPVVRAKASRIISLDEPMSTRAAIYKVKDAPIQPFGQVDFETEGFKEDKEFSTVLTTNFDRDLMAYDDLKEVLLNDSSRVPVDDKTDRAEVELKLINKSGSSSLRSYNILCNREVRTIPAQIFTVNEFVENYSSTKDFAAIEAEKEVYADSLWRKLGQTKLWSSKFIGGAAINTDYRVYLERPIFSKFGITVDFGYGSFEVKEGNSDVDTNVVSDREEYDKAVFTNRINTTYMGSFKQSFSEIAYLYKEVEFQDEIVDAYFDDAKKEKKYTPTTETFKAVFVEKWKSGKVDETPFEWTRNRGLEEGPAYTRICKDTYNYTSTPDINVKSSKVTKKGDKGEEWTANEDKGTISSSVEFNGAEKADVLFYSVETNDVKLTYKGKVQEFGHDSYSFTLKPNLGSGSVKDGYTVYPYTATLNYTFGDAAAKQATDKGTIKVEEERFLKWGDIEYAVATTTMSQNVKTWDYCVSIHMRDKKTGKLYVLPVRFAHNAPHTPIWDFNLVEECSKDTYDKYNSMSYDLDDGRWKNSWAEDSREWLQWTRVETGKAYWSISYQSAKGIDWDKPSYISDRATVNTKRYKCEVKDGRLFITDTYDNVKITDSHCVNGGWK